MNCEHDGEQDDDNDDGSHDSDLPTVSKVDMHGTGDTDHTD